MKWMALAGLFLSATLGTDDDRSSYAERFFRGVAPPGVWRGRPGRVAKEQMRPRTAAPHLHPAFGIGPGQNPQPAQTGVAQTLPSVPPADNPAAPITLDDFESLAAWSPHPSDGVDLHLAQEAGAHGQAMRLDFDFHSRGGYAIARRKVDLDLPANYAFTFALRANAPINNLEFKLIDSSGENVWWVNRRDFEFPHDWKTVSFKKRQISFAWGPAGGGEARHIAAIEIVVTAGTGGQGTVWIDDVTLTPLPPSRSGAATFGPWRSDDNTPAFTADLGQLREIGGLQLDWDLANYAADYIVELSRDGEHFETVRTVTGGRGGRRFLYLPDAEARLIRIRSIRSSAKTGVRLDALKVQPVDWAPTTNDFFSLIARESRPGHYPRYLLGEQTYWTIVGADGAAEEALVGEDGAVEPFKAGFSIEPFLYEHRLMSWSGSTERQTLEDGYLPIPTVTRQEDGLSLMVTATVSESSTLYLRYRVASVRDTRVKLSLAIRPFQVNPSTQFLNTTGGASPIHRLSYGSEGVTINGTQQLHTLTPPTQFGAATFDEGDITEFLRLGELPSSTSVEDTAFGYASGALSYDLDLRAGTAQEVLIAVPLAAPLQKGSAVRAPDFEAMAQSWRGRLNHLIIDIPAAPEIADTVRANLAYMLINRDGPALQPGSRSYERAWIRDGALIASVLLRMGMKDVPAEFAKWFAKYQYDNGKVPCCVDKRGADPVPENDSHGELILLVGDLYRATHKISLVRKLWPRVDGAARYIQLLRSQNHNAFEGLVTESISHEGYSAKPQHSYWDDFFALRGMYEASRLAGVIGKGARQRELAAQAEDFRRDLVASIERTMKEHAIDFIPGSAELGDFDATSTAIGVSPLGLTSILPGAALDRTFAKYLEEFRARRDGRKEWDDYTPYEMRIIGALVRRGERAAAHELLDYFMNDRRPAGWRHWAEVVGRDPRKPRFIGDMPHSWIASDFMRSVLDFFAFEREDGALVAGAGIPARWIEGRTLHVGPLPTAAGAFELSMRGESKRVWIDLGGHLRPSGGIVVRSPYDLPIREATVDGKSVEHTDSEITVKAAPAKVVFRY